MKVDVLVHRVHERCCATCVCMLNACTPDAREMLRDLRVHVECVYMLTATAPFYISLLAAAPAVTLWAHGAGQTAAMLQLQLQTSDSLRS